MNKRPAFVRGEAVLKVGLWDDAVSAKGSSAKPVR